MNNEAPTVVVGVDGSPGSRAAVRYGIAEARRMGAGVTLTHVVSVYAGTSPTPVMVMPPEDLLRTGRHVLDGEAARAAAAAPDLEIGTELRRGSRSHELVDAGASAHVLVVGRDTRPLVERLVLGNTVTGVSCRASCPVVSVPADWADEASRGVVVVGIKSASHSEELLADAFAVAARAGARVRAVHAWKFAGGYDDLVADRTVEQGWNERAREEVDDLLSRWRKQYPGVPTQVVALHDDAPHALARAAEDADVLTIVRRAHGVPAARHLGGTARAVLRTASCPVRVVPPDTQRNRVVDRADA